MAITALDHIYVETRDWEAAVAFWKGLGFAERWGSEGHRAGRLAAGSATVVLAEVEEAAEPGFSVFFSLEDADDFMVGDAVEVMTPLSQTHWGTRWMRVRDGEANVYSLEEADH